MLMRPAFMRLARSSVILQDIAHCGMFVTTSDSRILVGSRD